MHGLAVYMKEGLPFARDLSLENSADSYLCFWLALLHSVSYFFFLYWSPFSALCTVFDSISSNIVEVLLINLSVNVLSLETLTSMIRTGLPILVEMNDLVNSVIIFLSQITLPGWLTFLLGSQTAILIVTLFWVYFLLRTLVFVLQWLSLHFCCCLSFHWLSNKYKTECPISFHSLWLFSCWLGWSSWSFEWCSMGEYL